MASKIRFTVTVLIMLMFFSGVVCGKNLLLGGINQDAPCDEPCSSSANMEYKKIAASLDADYIPMYYGGMANDVNQVREAALGIATEQNGLEQLKSLKNKALYNPYDAIIADYAKYGLKSQKNKATSNHYETIVAYSGGTATAVTALADYAKYGLTCDTLILISPMAAAVRQDTIDNALSAGIALGLASAQPVADIPGIIKNGIEVKKSVESADAEGNAKFEEQIKAIMTNNPNLKLIVIQSQQDKPTPAGIGSEAFQYTFTKDENSFKEFENRITIHNEKLDSKGSLLDKGINAHTDLFFEYAKTHLANDGNGITFSETGQSTAYPTKSNVYKISGDDWEMAENLSQRNNLNFHYGRPMFQLPPGARWQTQEEMMNRPGPSAPSSPGPSAPDLSAVDNLFQNPTPEFEQALQDGMA